MHAQQMCAILLQYTEIIFLNPLPSVPMGPIKADMHPHQELTC
jgi:hypothetical protein